MESTHARRVLPCFDEPGYKATFTVTVGHETEMKPVSNMPDMLSRPMLVLISTRSLNLQKPKTLLESQ